MKNLITISILILLSYTSFSQCNTIKVEASTECIWGNPIGGFTSYTDYQLIIKVTQGDLSTIQILATMQGGCTDCIQFTETFSQSGIWYSTPIYEDMSVTLVINDNNNCDNGLTVNVSNESKCSCPHQPYIETPAEGVCIGESSNVEIDFHPAALSPQDFNTKFSLDLPSGNFVLDKNISSGSVSLTPGTYNYSISEDIDRCNYSSSFVVKEREILEINEISNFDISSGCLNEETSFDILFSPTNAIDSFYLVKNDLDTLEQNNTGTFSTIYTTTGFNEYKIISVDICDNIIKDSVQVFVDSPPTITGQVSDSTILTGDSITLKVVTNIPSLINWYSNDGLIKSDNDSINVFNEECISVNAYANNCYSDTLSACIDLQSLQAEITSDILEPNQGQKVSLTASIFNNQGDVTFEWFLVTTNQRIKKSTLYSTSEIIEINYSDYENYYLIVTDKSTYVKVKSDLAFSNSVINNLQAPNFQTNDYIFPTQSNGIYYLKNENTKTISIYSINGILLKSLIVQQKIDITDLPSGSYLIKSNKNTFKVIKQ